MASKDEYLNHLKERLDLMNQVVKLSNLTGDDHCLLQECHQRLRSVEKLQSEMQPLIRTHEEHRREMSGMPKQLEQLLSLADYVNGAVAKAVDEAKLAKPRQPPPATPGSRRHVDAAAASTGIAYLTSEEFDHVPKYMKGRQTVETLNKCVDAFNKALAAKYELFSRPRAQLRDSHWTKLNAFKSQESRETKGVKFITETDLKAGGGPFETSKAVNNFVVVMRHCGRLREVRGQGFVRYAVL